MPSLEPALHVEALADARRQPLLGHHGLPERCVGRRQHDGQHDGLEKRELSEQRHRDERAGDERERETDPEQPRRYRRLTVQSADVDARCVCEQHEAERRLGEHLHRVPVGVDVDHAEHVRSE